MKVLVFIANGTEDTELVTTLDLLKRAGIESKLVSLNTLEVTLSHGLVIKCDSTIRKLEITEALSYDSVFLPGGSKGVERMLKCDRLMDILKIFNFNNRVISAICAAPKVLYKAGILDYKKFTCYDGCEEGIKGAFYMEKAPVVKDSNIITGRSLNYSIDFSLELINVLLGEDAAFKVKKGILKED